MIRKLLSLVLLTLSLCVFSQINSNNPTVPFGSNATYAYGILPTNLPSGGTYGKSSEVATYYNQWKTDYVVNCGSNQARVKFDDVNYTVSEGIAYGMLLAAYAGDKPLLDKLWAYYSNFKNSNGVMHWKINGCNTVDQQNGATDAELDAAMALVVASKQWPNASSPYTYANEAKSLINAIKNKESASDGTFYNGDMWHPSCRNPSYQAAAYTRVFKAFMSENGTNQDAFWDKMATGTEILLANNAHSSSGLPTNWCLPNGDPNSSCSGSGTAYNKFGYDACRAPWREGVDYLWWGSSATGIQTIVNRQADFWIGKGGASQVMGGDGLNHDGSGWGNHNGAFVGMVGAMSLAASNTTAHQTFCNNLYTENKNNGLSTGYFTKILQMIGLFVQTGNFWNPYATSSTGNQSPTVSMGATTSSTCLGVPFQLIATASDKDGTISKVEFYDGATLIATKTASPYTYDVTNATSGQHAYTAKAFDNANATRTSSAVNVSISSVQSSDGKTCDAVATSGDFTAAIDDFDAVSEVSVTNSTAGIFWWVATDATSTYKITRATTGMTLALTNANSNNAYKVFGLNFGKDNYINLKDFSNANIKLNVTNNSNQNIFMTVQLKDINGVAAEIVPEDPTAISWTNQWAKMGIEAPKGQTTDFTIDLSTRANELGGLTAVSYGCGTPAACPTTSYSLDPSKIVEVVFIVNGGAGVDDKTHSPATGNLIFNYFSIGEITNSKSNIIKKGASVAPKDADNDGVADDSDACANTPIGENVNASGCSTSQIDTDKDGVKDNVDDCPGTANGSSVNADGCSTAQLDSDNDGIKDNVDLCPGTASGTVVNNSGCNANGLEEAEEFGIQVYPIPASKSITIEQSNLQMKKASLRNVSGIEVLSVNLKSANETISISGIEKGIYILILEGDNSSVQKRVVIE